jgi:hypothetical protein
VNFRPRFRSDKIPSTLLIVFRQSARAVIAISVDDIAFPTFWSTLIRIFLASLIQKYYFINQCCKKVEMFFFFPKEIYFTYTFQSTYWYFLRVNNFSSLVLFPFAPSRASATLILKSIFFHESSFDPTFGIESSRGA